MKILFFVRLFYPHIGGVEKHVYKISKQLQKDNHQITVITEKYSENIPSFEEYDKIKIYRIPIRTNNWFKKFRIWIWLLKNRLIISNSDVIHCHDVFFWYLPFKVINPIKKVFTTFHGYESYPVSKKVIIVRKISEILSTGSICIGEFMKKWYHANPDYVSYGAADFHEKKNSKIKKNSAVFIGRLDDQTGILTYQKAIDILRKKYKDFIFTIVGDGKYKNMIHMRYETVGFRKEVMQYLSGHNFAFVSRYLSLLEAMISKRLVFAVYDNPIKEDYLKMTPFNRWIIIENNPKKLADRIQYYIENPDKKNEKINEAYDWVLKQTWDKMTEIYLQLWKK